MKNSNNENWNAAALQLWQEHAVLAQDEQRASTGCQVGSNLRSLSVMILRPRRLKRQWNGPWMGGFVRRSECGKNRILIVP